MPFISDSVWMSIHYLWPLAAFFRAPALEHSLRTFLGKSFFHDRSSFVKAKAGQVAAAMCFDSCVKLGRGFFGCNLFAGGHQGLQELKSEIGPLRVRQG